jgi:hypothetical protein
VNPELGEKSELEEYNVIELQPVWETCYIQSEEYYIEEVALGEKYERGY